jgi:beta-glucuronidase
LNKKPAFYFFLFLTILICERSAAVPRRSFELANPGAEKIINYKKYGTFVNVGTDKYGYKIFDREGLKRAAGEGVYPNTTVLRNKNLQKFIKNKKGKIDPWHHVNGESAEEDFYAWAQDETQDKGVRLFHMAEALRRGGQLRQALKAYYAIVVHFPRSLQWSADGSFYWYLAPEAISRIRKICATYPELGLRLDNALVDIDRSPVNNPRKDRIRVWPGKFVGMDLSVKDKGPAQVSHVRGNGRVRLVKYNNRFWRLLVDGKPFIVKGVTYTCTTVGESAHALNLRPWMRLDDNHNGKNDGMFDSWVDENKNNRKDKNEAVIGDATLLYQMGANTIRVYHGVDEWSRYNPKEYDKNLMRQLNRDYGLFFIMGDFVGAYTVGSGANWEAGTDYTDETQKARMKDVVRAMVMDHKDEPYVLMWLLGNENQHAHTHTNANEQPEAYAKFLNEVAAMIHEIDPNHPVAVGNLNVSGLKQIAQYAPQIDIYGANVYSGAYSMGSIWQLVKAYFDRPVLITEMGCDAYTEGKGVDEQPQADYFTLNWKDIELNVAGAAGEGNAIGGVVFEWMDEWWKSSRGNSWGDPDIHNEAPDTRGAAPDGWMHEEWLGIFGQGDGSESHFLREPRKVYQAIKKSWTGE